MDAATGLDGWFSTSAKHEEPKWISTGLTDPAHQSDEFWYQPKEAVLLYENRGKPSLNYLEAKHSPQDSEAHYRERPNSYVHHVPHGLTFTDYLQTPHQRARNAANTELLIRLCNELGLAPRHEPDQSQNALLPVPKFLAMFLEANRTQMHKTEYVNQAIALMQTQALVAKTNAAD